MIYACSFDWSDGLVYCPMAGLERKSHPWHPAADRKHRRSPQPPISVTPAVAENPHATLGCSTSLPRTAE